MTSEHVLARTYGWVAIRAQNAERRTQNARSGACGVGRVGLGSRR